MIHNILKNINKSLLPTRLRNQIDIFSSLRGRFDRPELMDSLKEKNILVLAPHPDDEILGCGGTLHRHHLSGGEITSIYMGYGSWQEQGFASYKEMVRTRKDEAGEAAGVIGIDDLIFLDYEYLTSVPMDKVANELASLLNNIKPDCVYLPSFLDYQKDHIATNNIFAAALKETRERFVCYGYEVWTPLLPNCMVDISNCISKKKEAIEKFKSQLKRANFTDAFLGLSKYRSVMSLNGDSYVECFFRSTPEEYLRLTGLLKKY